MAHGTCARVKPSPGATFFRFVCPLICLGLPLGWHLANPCSNYSPTLTWSTFGIFLFTALMVYAIAIIRIPIGYCSPKQARDHMLFWLALWNAMGATLGAYDFYTYSLNVYSSLWAILMWILVFPLIIPNFCKGHLHNCPEEDEEDLPAPIAATGTPLARTCGRNGLAATTILMILGWMTLPGFLIGYDPSLRNGPRSGTLCEL